MNGPVVNDAGAEPAATAAPPPSSPSSSALPAHGRRFPLHIQIVAAMALGLVVGPLLGRDARALGELGKVVIEVIKAAATPLLFFAIVNAILKTEVPPGKAGRLLFWASINASIALTLGLVISNLLEPGKTLAGFVSPGPEAAAAYANKKIDLMATFTGFVPTNFVTPFAQNVVLSVIFIALFLGFALRRVRREQLAAGVQSFRAIEDLVATMLRLMEIVLGWVIKLIPLAVFGVVARAVGEHGFGPLKGLATYVAVGVGGLALHILVTYHIELLLLARIPVRVFWRAAKEPVIYAAGANSSLATLPVTLRALDRLGVSRGASVLGAGIGTNFNNDGIILYEGMALLFVAQAAGIDLTLGQQLVAAAACLVTAMGVAGIPEAGFISLALVLNTVGLPIELLPLLLTADWIIARGRSITNVLSDMMLSILIDRDNPGGSPTATSRLPAPP